MKHLMLFAILMFCCSACRTTERAADSDHPFSNDRLLFVIGDDEPAPQFPVRWDQHGKPPVYLASEPLLSEWNIKSIQRTTADDGRPAIGLTWDEAGTSIMRSASEANLNKMLVITWDGKIIAAPHILTKLGSKAIIVPEDPMPRAEFDEIVAYLESVTSQ